MRMNKAMPLAFKLVREYHYYIDELLKSGKTTATPLLAEM